MHTHNQESENNILYHKFVGTLNVIIFLENILYTKCTAKLVENHLKYFGWKVSFTNWTSRQPICKGAGKKKAKVIIYLLKAVNNKHIYLLPDGKSERVFFLFFDRVTVFRFLTASKTTLVGLRWRFKRTASKLPRYDAWKTDADISTCSKTGRWFQLQHILHCICRQNFQWKISQ